MTLDTAAGVQAGNHLPRSAALLARTGAGDARIEGIDHVVDLDSRAGDVDLVDLTGEVFAHTSAGDVHGEALRCTSGVVETDAGDVDLVGIRRDSSSPHRLVASTRAGDITLEAL